MQAFVRLMAALETPSEGPATLGSYLSHATPADAAWAVYLLAGGKLRQAAPAALLRQTAQAAAGLDDWLFEASHAAVGDLAETIALVLPKVLPVDDSAPPCWPPDAAAGLADWIEQGLTELRLHEDAAPQAHWLLGAWGVLDVPGRLLLNKLIAGHLRPGLNLQQLHHALAEQAGLPAAVIAQRLAGYTHAAPGAAAYLALIDTAHDTTRHAGTPYPLAAAQPFTPGNGMGSGWHAEWKYDGLRAQLVKRAGQIWLWSRAGELINACFPDVVAAALALPDGTVLDGELLVWPDGAHEQPGPQALLPTRLGRKAPSRKQLAEAPVQLLAFDLLEAEGVDLRRLPWLQRRQGLEELQSKTKLRISQHWVTDDETTLATQQAAGRARGLAGLVLKQAHSRYDDAEVPWRSWKLPAQRLNAVLIYAQAAQGRQASAVSAFGDYTLAVWSRTPVDAAEAHAVLDAITRREPPQADALQLVTCVKTDAGLSDTERRVIEQVIRQTTVEKFGPVRSLRPTLVLELSFEGLQASRRHKCGVVLRTPCLLRLRQDVALHSAATLPDLMAFLQQMP